jgi:predicted RNA binding protein YcfA (HicA-like mRNA interferase family)
MVTTLERDGFFFVRQSGSHVVLHHAGRDRTVSEPVHGTRVLSLRLTHRLLDQAGLPVAEFTRLLK